MNENIENSHPAWLDRERQEELVQRNNVFLELMMIYRCAIREVQTKLEVLNDEFSVRYSRNPIENISTRIKKPLSIARKLEKKQIEPTIRGMRENLFDIAGVRVICGFIDDIYMVADMLARQDDIQVITIKDYIKHPKENGYRSYHMIVEVPVFFSDRKELVKVEVQIRTIAMDFWASLEHQIRYKKQIDEEADLTDISAQLLDCAEVIAKTDERMQNIKEMIGEFIKID